MSLLYDNKFDRWSSEFSKMNNVQVEKLEKNLNKILLPENKGKKLFYPYKTGQTHAGLKRDVSIVLDQLELYRDFLDPEALESGSLSQGPSKRELREFSDECFYIDRYLETLDQLDKLIKLFEDIQDIVEEDLTHREKQRFIHLIVHSAGLSIGRSPLKKEELPDEEIVTEWHYEVNIFNLNASDYLSEITGFLEEKAEEREMEKQQEKALEQLPKRPDSE